MNLFVPYAIFALVFAWALVFVSSRVKQADQARALVRRMSVPVADRPREIVITRERRHVAGEILTWLYRINLLAKLEESMWQAGMRLRVSEMLLIIVLMFGAGYLGGQRFQPDSFFSLGLGLALALLPLLYIRFLKSRRLSAFDRQLPHALEMIKSSLEAGHSLQRGLQALVKEFADPLGGEFRTVLEQTRIGLPLPHALEQMLRRVPQKDLRLLIVAVKVQSDVGSSLAQIVGRLSETVRTRQRIRLQMRTLTAQSRMSGYLVGALPFIVLAAFTILQPSYAHTLFEDPAGIKLLKLAIGLDLAAILSIRRLINIEY